MKAMIVNALVWVFDKIFLCLRTVWKYLHLIIIGIGCALIFASIPMSYSVAPNAFPLCLIGGCVIVGLGFLLYDARMK